MKKSAILFSLLISFASCKVEFQSNDVSKFNAFIAESHDITSAEDLMRHYYVYSKRTLTTNVQLTTTILGNDVYEVALINDDIRDDSVSGEKLILTAKLENGKWNVISIKENWKCSDGRGHFSWGTEPCD